MNEPLIEALKPTSVAIVQRVEEAELDEMWSFVGSKKYQRWLWHAINHKTGQILAYVLADHKDDAFKQLEFFKNKLRGQNRKVGMVKMSNESVLLQSSVALTQ